MQNTENKLSKYEIQANEFLDNTKTRIFARAMCKESNKYGEYIKYQVSIIRDRNNNICDSVPRQDIFYCNCPNINPREYMDKNKGYLFEFSDCIDNCTKNIRPNVYDILSCLSHSAYDIELFEDWCMNFGYDSDSRKAYSIYQACLDEHLQLKKLFSHKELELLQEIQ